MGDERRVIRQWRFRPPPGATEILLVRHGESEPAVAGQSFALLDGQSDPALSPEGEEEAERVSERLASEHIDAIYVSTLRRTAQTAAPLARRVGFTPVVDPDLREVFLGEWEGGGIFRERVTDQDPLAMRMFEEQRWDVVPGAESMESFGGRLRGVVDRIAAAHPDQRVAVFAHGGVIGEILRQTTDSRPFAFVGADNGSISHIVITDERWILRRFNDTSHLQPAMTTRPEPLT
ncbi:MAG: histidine phosphatase family protein [Actinobacteria bacterium]|nr:MAG: histidine phosphatase family protein [Actinomycetota bacterium]